MKNILAAIDFSEITPTVADKAAEIAKCCSSKLWLIHVAAPNPDFIGYETGPQTERNWRAKTLREEHLYLQNKALELEKKGISVTPLLIQGATVEIILKEAVKLKAEMIVVGSHGHGALHQALVGSVSEAVIRQANCPVLVVPTRIKT